MDFVFDLQFLVSQCLTNIPVKPVRVEMAPEPSVAPRLEPQLVEVEPGAYAVWDPELKEIPRHDRQ